MSRSRCAALYGFRHGDLATSDGIFVFNGNNDSVGLGDVVRVAGTAGEFQDQTQISSVTSIANCGTGSVTAVDVTLPVPSADFLEQYEGMLVRFPQTLYVTEHFQLGRFGQVVMSANARLQQPTNVMMPGAPALALQAANNLNRIIVDDELNNQNPDPILFGRGGNPLSASNTLRGGDTATGMVGVLTYTWSGNAASGNAYRLRPVGAIGGVPDFQPANPRPASAPVVDGNVNVVGMNLLNFFNTFGVDQCHNGLTGSATDCRGADDAFEFDRQWRKTVAAILALDADIIGVNELENDGYGPDSSLQFLVDRLNDAAGPGTYAFIDVDASTGQIVSLYAPDEFRVSDHDPMITGLAVCDEIPPTLSVSVTPDRLWPPNHHYVDVEAALVTSDNFDPNPTVMLVEVESNEPDNGLGDGDTANDVVIIDDTHFQLRAERSGVGTGRVYTITYRVTDACGNNMTASATVTVPLSQQP